MEYLISIITGIIGSVIAAEISANRRRWCTSIIASAVLRLPEDQREIRFEEWLAALNDQDSIIGAYRHAVGCWLSAPAVAAASQLETAGVRKDGRVVSTFKIALRTLNGFKQEIGNLGSFFKEVLKFVGVLAIIFTMADIISANKVSALQQICISQPTACDFIATQSQRAYTAVLNSITNAYLAAFPPKEIKRRAAPTRP